MDKPFWRINDCCLIEDMRLPFVTICISTVAPSLASSLVERNIISSSAECLWASRKGCGSGDAHLPGNDAPHLALGQIGLRQEFPFSRPLPSFLVSSVVPLHVMSQGFVDLGMGNGIRDYVPSILGARHLVISSFLCDQDSSRLFEPGKCITAA
jgi:hypothetical protein